MVAGADLNAKDKLSRSAMELAAAGQREDAAGMLNAAGIDLPDKFAYLKTHLEFLATRKEAGERLKVARMKLDAARKELEASKAAREKQQ